MKGKLKRVKAIALTAALMTGMLISFGETAEATNSSGDPVTPPLGWNTFDTFYDNDALNEQNVKEIADYMAENMKDSGYVYVNLDGGWWNNKSGQPIQVDEYGRPQPGEVRFPSSKDGNGLKSLADYVHSKGLKLGLYAMRGIPRVVTTSGYEDIKIKGTELSGKELANIADTCSWTKDNYGIDWENHPDEAQAYYDSLFEMWEEWGIDFIKIDDLVSPIDDYHKNDVYGYSKARENTKSDIIISASPGNNIGADQEEWVMEILDHVDMFRATGDVWDNWSDTNKQFDRAKAFVKYAKPGAWVDLDMLPYGKIRDKTNNPVRQSKLTNDEIYTSMTLHCIAKSPLIMGGDVRELKDDPFTLEVLTNSEALAVNQEGTNQGCFYDEGNITKWVSDAGNNEKYVALFNRTSGKADISFNFADIKLSSEYGTIRDLWKKSDIGTYKNSYKVSVPSHGAVLLKVSPTTEEHALPSLRLSSSGEAVYAGGESTITTTLINDGLSNVKSAEVSIQAPSDWEVSNVTPDSFDNIPVGETVTVQWKVRLPRDASNADNTLITAVEFAYGEGTRQLQETKNLIVIPLGGQYLSDMEWKSAFCGWGPVERDMNVGGKKPNDGKPITLNNVVYSKGLGTNPDTGRPSEIVYDLDGKYSRFTAIVGIDDNAGTEGQGSVVFEVYCDGEKRWESGIMKCKDEAQSIDLDITGVNELNLTVTDGGDTAGYDNADWANAMVTSGMEKVNLAVQKNPLTIGDTTPIQAKAVMTNGSEILLEDSEVTYISSDETIVTVTDGVVTGIAEGDAVITANALMDGMAGSGSVNVTVEKEVPVLTGLRIDGEFKDTYIQGEELDFSSANVIAMFTGGSEIILNSSEYVVSGYDKTKIGDQTVKISYTFGEVTKSIELPVTVNKAEGEDVRIIGISAGGDYKNVYELGEELDLTGLTVNVVYSDDSVNELSNEEYTVEGYDNTKAGEQTLTISYNDNGQTYQTTIVVTINSTEAILLTDIRAEGNYKKVYAEGESLDLSGLKIIAEYSNGSEEEVPTTEYIVTGYDKNQVGEQELRISVTKGDVTKSVTVKITVEERKGGNDQTQPDEWKGSVSCENKDGIPSTNISGIFSRDAILNINKIPAEGDIYKKLEAMVSEGMQNIGIYDLEIIGDAEGPFKITFMVGDKYNGRKAIVYHMKADGEIEIIDAAVQNGKIIIIVDTLSPFMITATKDATRGQENNNSSNNSNGSNNSEGNNKENQITNKPSAGQSAQPQALKTGDDSSSVIVLLVVGILAGSVVAITLKKRKRL